MVVVPPTTIAAQSLFTAVGPQQPLGSPGSQGTYSGRGSGWGGQGALVHCFILKAPPPKLEFNVNHHSTGV